MKNPIWISTMERDKTTDIVLEYIYYLEERFKRIHIKDVISNISIELGSDRDDDKLTILLNDDELEINNVVKMWYRRGDFSYKFPVSEIHHLKKLNDYLLQEWQFVKNYLHSYASILGGYYQEKDSNKLNDLRTARDCGLDIPSTLVTTRKERLKEFYHQHKKIITKPIHNSHLSFIDDKKKYSSKGIVFVTNEVIKQSNDEFCLSLFQAYVEKLYEIRIFFIHKDLYCMAIFSQLDNKTKYDYRNYNLENPNRNVPYKLPVDVHEKILLFIEKSQLDTGSIDLIYSSRDEYVFLEVNPSGQFGWVSGNCNYYLEKRIAEYLINYKK